MGTRVVALVCLLSAVALAGCTEPLQETTFRFDGTPSCDRPPGVHHEGISIHDVSDRDQAGPDNRLDATLWTEDGLCFQAVATNPGDEATARTHQWCYHRTVSMGISRLMDGQWGPVQREEPTGNCDGGHRCDPWLPGERIAPVLAWDGLVWDDEAERRVPAPVGTYSATASFSTYDPEDCQAPVHVSSVSLRFTLR